MPLLRDQCEAYLADAAWRDDSARAAWDWDEAMTAEEALYRAGLIWAIGY